MLMLSYFAVAVNVTDTDSYPSRELQLLLAAAQMHFSSFSKLRDFYTVEGRQFHWFPNEKINVIRLFCHSVILQHQ